MCLVELRPNRRNQGFELRRRGNNQYAKRRKRLTWPSNSQKMKFHANRHVQNTQALFERRQSHTKQRLRNSNKQAFKLKPKPFKQSLQRRVMHFSYMSPCHKNHCTVSKAAVEARQNRRRGRGLLSATKSHLAQRPTPLVPRAEPCMSQLWRQRHYIGSVSRVDREQRLP